MIRRNSKLMNPKGERKVQLTNYKRFASVCERHGERIRQMRIKKKKKEKLEYVETIQ